MKARWHRYKSSHVPFLRHLFDRLSCSNFNLGPSPSDSAEKNPSNQSLWFWSAVFLLLDVIREPLYTICRCTDIMNNKNLNFFMLPKSFQTSKNGTIILVSFVVLIQFLTRLFEPWFLLTTNVFKSKLTNNPFEFLEPFQKDLFLSDFQQKCNASFSASSCWEIIIIKQIHTFTSNIIVWTKNFEKHNYYPFLSNDFSVWVAPAFTKSNGKKRTKTNQCIATYLCFQN